MAFVAEYASTRVGVPFGLYHYTELTRGVELYLSNVPFFDSLSFPFLAYASFCLARRTLGTFAGMGVVWLAGVLMMLLDVVIDPLAVRGDRWFLGRVFYYPAGGVYFGVPLSNFAGWVLVGWTIVGGYVLVTPAVDPGPKEDEGSTGAGVALYSECCLQPGDDALDRGVGAARGGNPGPRGGFLLLYLFSARLARQRSRRAGIPLIRGRRAVTRRS